MKRLNFFLHVALIIASAALLLIFTPKTASENAEQVDTAPITSSVSSSQPFQCQYEFAGEFDIDRLAYAVAMQESGDCTKGRAARLGNNNCHSIKSPEKHLRHMEFETKEQGYEYFKGLWNRSYGGFPDRIKAHKYVVGLGNLPEEGWSPHVCNWIQNVSHHY